MHRFVRNKSFNRLLDISLKNLIFLKTFNSEFSYIEVWFTDKNSKTLEYCRNEQAVNSNDSIVDFNAKNATNLFEIKEWITVQTGNDETKSVETVVAFKHLSNFWGTLEMSLFNCKVNLILYWSANCVIIPTVNVNYSLTFAITDLKLYVVVLSKVSIEA